jgi:hypothetical protein
MRRNALILCNNFPIPEIYWHISDQYYSYCRFNKSDELINKFEE